MKSKKKAAEPRAKKPKAEKRTVAEQMADALRKHLGRDDVAKTLEDDGGYSSVREVMPTRLLPLDHHVIGIGGLPYGRIVEIRGSEDTGKSSLVNHLIWAAQQDGAVASLGDSERKVSPNWVDVFKVKKDEVLLLPVKTIEQWLEEVKVTIRKFGSRHKLVFILDSIATSTPQKAEDEDLEDSEIPGAQAAAWSRGLRQLNKLISERLVLVVLINQLRSKIGVLYGPKEESASGRAIRHYSSLRLEMNHGSSRKVGTEHVGKWFSVRSIKNHLAPGFKSAKVLLNFDTGFDDDRTTLLFAKEVGAVDVKCQSVKAARAALNWNYDEAAADVLVDDVAPKERE